MFSRVKILWAGPKPPSPPKTADTSTAAREKKPEDKENEAKNVGTSKEPAPASSPASPPASAPPPAPTPAPVQGPGPTPSPAPAQAPTLAPAPVQGPTPAPAPAQAPTVAPAPAQGPTPTPAPAPGATPAGEPGKEGEEMPPPEPRPVVINQYSDEQLLAIVKKMRERTEHYKEKVLDQYASSPEITPPVTPLLGKDRYARVMEERTRQAEEDRIVKEEADKKKKEEQEQKKKEADQKKKETEEQKKEEMAALALEKQKKKKLAEVAFASVDAVLRPLEEAMDSVLGHTIDPFTDRVYIAWLSLVTLAFNYNIWFSTARLCFPYHTAEAIPYWFLLDSLADLVYLVDCLLFQPRKQFVKGGDVIKDRLLTKKNYRNTERFKTDMMCLIPFDLLYMQFGFKSIFRANRLLKAETFFEFSDRLESLMTKAYIWRVIRTIGYLLFMLHINACFYYVASDYQGIGQTKWVYSGKGSAYLRCFYHAVRSLINIGGLSEPHTVFEITFQMLNFFIGVFVFSSLIGQMRDVIGAATTGQTYFRTSMDNTVSYMVNNHIPALVQNRIRTWYTYTWDAQGMLDESELLDKMPLVMRTAIAVDINLATFQKIALFQGCDQQMLLDMLLRLKSIIYLPGDFVVKKGDIGKEMYIIKSGAVQVVGGPDNSIVFVTLKAGCVFGEISLLQSSKDGGNRRTANVKAQGFANLFVLEKKDLFDILVHYPESQKVLARKGKKLMKAKGPAAKTEEQKKTGLALFGPKPPTPKLLRAFGGNFNKLLKLKNAAS
ncbi:cyclic nucleotide-gated cation channel beta-3-like isoform X2 [Gadus morhua]|uniref:cyclic nucleotide-gated cation channel beta-3-like isoform X2 n=1 Tax=Gadus morhua TaxID=8049 RepID=UPI0011B83759|nr:cyclic nucleotide-gated cation channel beta-3-like isoform X2 [Gadus morhua]